MNAGDSTEAIANGKTKLQNRGSCWIQKCFRDQAFQLSGECFKVSSRLISMVLLHKQLIIIFKSDNLLKNSLYFYLCDLSR